MGHPDDDQACETQNCATLDTVTSAYDSNGRLHTTSLPCATSWDDPCATAAQTFTYDALNRPYQIVDAGGGTTTYTYSQNDVLVVLSPAPGTEHDKQRQYEYDALGRLTSVCEITGASGSGSCGQNTPATGYLTTYSYDALANLVGVMQAGTQTRTYYYDTLGRLTSETNPESGTTNYTVVGQGQCL